MSVYLLEVVQSQGLSGELAVVKLGLDAYW